MRKTYSGTVWVIPANALQMFRATCRRDTKLFTMAGGGTPIFDPETARYASSDMVANVAANVGMTIRGDIASARVFAKGQHAWKTTMDLDGLLAHSAFGKDMPTKEELIEAYRKYDLPIVHR